MSTQFPISPYEVPSISVQNLLAGNIGAAGRALIAPETLSPKELQRLSDKFGNHKEQNPVIQAILDISTNPLFLLSAGLAIAFPVAGKEAVALWKDKLAKDYAAHGPLLSIVRPPIQVFAGTKIWPLMQEIWDSIIGHEIKFDATLSKSFRLFQRDTGHLPTQRDLWLISAKLGGLDSMAGQDAVGMLQAGLPISQAVLRNVGPEVGFLKPHQRIYEAVRQGTGYVWDAHQAGMKANPQGVEDLIDNMGMKDAVIAKRGVGGWVALHWPRMAFHPRQEYMGMLEDMTAEGRVPYQERALARMTNFASMRTAARRGGVSMIPDLEGLQRNLPDLINQDTVTMLKGHLQDRRAKAMNTFRGLIATQGNLPETWSQRMQVALQEQGLPFRASRDMTNNLDNLIASGRGNEAVGLLDKYLDWKGNTPTYSLDFSVLPRYIKQMATELTWTVRGLGKQLEKEKDLLPDRVRKHWLEESYIPMLQGQRTHSQAMQSLFWGEQVGRAAEFFKGPLAQKYMPKQADWMFKQLTSPRSMSETGLGSSLAGYFYISTLGFNLAPAMKNLLQTVITTYPRVGMKATLGGLMDTLKGYSTFIEGRVSGGLSEYEALEKAFPAFMKEAVGQSDPLTKAMLQGDIAEGVAGNVRLSGSPLGGVVERVKQISLAAFSRTEQFNRIMTYNSGRRYAVGLGLDGAEASNVASRLAGQIIHETQFPAGPLGMPPALVNIPGVARQFSYFPLRYLGFLATPTAQGGGLGMLGRVGMASTAAAIGLRDLLGANLEGGLAFGAMPLPTYEGAPFYPWPLVPPALGAVGGLVQAAASGDPSKLGPTAALLVPGGIALRRTWRTMSPSYADFANPDPDGRISTYNDKHELVGKFRPLQLYMRFLGLNPMDMEAERSMTSYLLKQRDQIRQYRVEYMTALATNDQEKGDGIQAEFEKRYPGLGGIQVKQADIAAMESRNQMTRIQRIIQGIPKAYRGEFERYASVAMGQSVANQMTQSPDTLDMLVTPDVTQMNPQSPFGAASTQAF